VTVSRSVSAGRFRTEQINVVVQISACWTETPRFVRNVLISLPTFLIDLALLYLLVRRLLPDDRLATFSPSWPPMA
jgi:hypothetical protein